VIVQVGRRGRDCVAPLIATLALLALLAASGSGKAQPAAEPVGVEVRSAVVRP